MSQHEYDILYQVLYRISHSWGDVFLRNISEDLIEGLLT
jgi:hypothetical protein